ncbi:MAG: NAD(P)-dependent oxidoreductase [bacterium]
MPKKTILITGATGFIGKYFAEKFADLGYKVIACGRKTVFAFENPKIKYLCWDITTGIYRDKLTVDCVIHCASDVSPVGNEKTMTQVNVIGTKNVIDSFRAKKFIYISSASVYSADKPKNFITEETNWTPKFLNFYQKTKREAEVVVQQQAKNWIILRPHIVYGPGDTTLMPRVLKSRRGLRYLVVGDGKNSVSVTNIKNLFEITELSLNAQIKDQVFNVADKQTVKVADLLEYLWSKVDPDLKPIFIPIFLAKLMALLNEFAYKLLPLKNEPIITLYSLYQLTSQYTLSIEKAKKMLDCGFDQNYKQGLTEYFENQSKII